MDLRQEKAVNDRVEVVAARLAELGHPTRLAIFRLMVKAGESGASVGEIQQNIGIPGSTLSHHIAKLVKVNLVKQVRKSRTLYCVPQFAALLDAVDFLKEECCTNCC